MQIRTGGAEPEMGSTVVWQEGRISNPTPMCESAVHGGGTHGRIYNPTRIYDDEDYSPNQNNRNEENLNSGSESAELRAAGAESTESAE